MFSKTCGYLSASHRPLQSCPRLRYYHSPILTVELCGSNTFGWFLFSLRAIWHVDSSDQSRCFDFALREVYLFVGAVDKWLALHTVKSELEFVADNGFRFSWAHVVILVSEPWRFLPTSVSRIGVRSINFGLISCIKKKKNWMVIHLGKNACVTELDIFIGYHLRYIIFSSPRTPSWCRPEGDKTLIFTVKEIRKFLSWLIWPRV